MPTSLTPQSHQAEETIANTALVVTMSTAPTPHPPISTTDATSEVPRPPQQPGPFLGMGEEQDAGLANSAIGSAEVTGPVEQPTIPILTSEPMPGINTAKVAALTRLFDAAVRNPRFWAKESRVEALENALVIPVFDDKSLQQFFNHAMSDLKGEAAEKSSRTAMPAVMPTEEDGKAEAWSRYTEKARTEVRKELRKSGIKPTEEAVNTRVAEMITTLRQQEEGTT